MNSTNLSVLAAAGISVYMLVGVAGDLLLAYNDHDNKLKEEEAIDNIIIPNFVTCHKDQMESFLKEHYDYVASGSVKIIKNQDGSCTFKAVRDPSPHEIALS